MAGRKPEEAVEAFLEPLRNAALCITRQPFIASGYKPSATLHVAAFAPEGFPVPLDTKFGRNSIRLFVSHRYRIIATDDPKRGPWKISTAAYDYTILDQQNAEILVYHWHPEDAGPSYPHLHLSGSLAPLSIGDSLLPVPLGDMHVPTDRVSFEAVIRLLIEEFQVPTLKPQHEWRTILTRGEDAFKAWRTRSG